MYFYSYLAEFVPEFGWLWNKSLEKPVIPRQTNPGFLLKLRKPFQKPESWNNFNYNKNSGKKKEAKEPF
jgi:hypothetical protein